MTEKQPVRTTQAPSGEELWVGYLPVECEGCERPFMAADGPECPYCGKDNEP